MCPWICVLFPPPGVWASREKGNKAQAMKLLKAVQSRLGSDGGTLGGALAELGGGNGNGNGLVCVASKVVPHQSVCSAVFLMESCGCWESVQVSLVCPLEQAICSLYCVFRGVLAEHTENTFACFTGATLFP